MAPPTGLQLIGWVLLLPVFILDLAFYILSLAWLRRPSKPALQSVAHGDGSTDSRGAPRRSAKSPDTLVLSTYDGGKARTVYEMTRAAVRDFGPKVAMVTRRFIELKKIKETDKFPTKIFDDSDHETVTYAELGDIIHHFGAGLRSLAGMEPIPQLKKGQHFDDVTGKFVLVIFEDTCKQWTIALQGAFSQSLTVATCYSTLGEDAVIASVNETKATALLLNWKKAEKFANMSTKMPTLKTIIASTHEMPDGATIPPGNRDVRIVSTDEIIKIGKEKAAQYPPTPPRSQDVAVIMYTSGSTGKPKGVVMTHSSMVSAVSGMAMNVNLLRGEDVYVSYLPLAHVLALQIENVLLNAGAKICYSDARQLPKALGMFSPTIHAGVPKVWELLKNGLESKLAGGPVAAQVIFSTLIKWKMSAQASGLDTPLSNIFFRFISKQVFGGVLRFGVSGGGPMSASLTNFCRACFCCPIIQGYALTETCVGGCFQALDDERTGIVGPPVPCVEISLQSEPEITDADGVPYLHTDVKGANGEEVIGRGEIIMRGPCISSGYYKMKEKTKEEYDEEGFFHTGDIGQFTIDGVIQIIDRKKNLVKLKGGEYVAIESMETAFVASPFVSAVCVVANGDLDRPLAIVLANKKYLEAWGLEHKSSGAGESESLLGLPEREETRKAVIKSMVEAGKEAGLSPLELKVADCCIIADVQWGPGNGLTATMKIDRKQIYKMHEKELHDLLQRNGGLPS